MRKICFNFCQFAIELSKQQTLQNIIELSEKKMIILNCYTLNQESKKFNQTLISQLKKYSELGQLVNVDIQQHTKIQEELQIRAIPFVALVHQNTFIDVYQKNGDLEKFIASIHQLYRQLSGDEQAENILIQLTTASNNEEGDKLLEISKEALQNQQLKAYHPQFQLYTAQGHILNQELDQAKLILDKFESHSEDEQQLYKKIQEHYQTIKEFTEMPQELIQKLIKLDENPDDKDLRFEIAEQAYQIENYDLAIDMLLDIVRIERNWCDRKAQQKLQEYFGKLGSQHKSVYRGRIELAQLLYQ